MRACACFIVLGLAISINGGSTFAQSATPEVKSAVQPQPGVNIDEVQTRRTSLFQRMLEKPDDLDAAFEYAALSVQVGDLEAAVSTLERMLIFAPGLPRLQLELGVLYYRLSAFETARSYLESAVAGPDIPEEVRSKVDQYLSEIEDASKPTRFTGQIRTGIRYQSNANRAPTGGIIVLNGIPFILDPNAQGKADGNVYGAGVFHVSHQLASQGDTIEADLVAYGSKQFSLNELDMALAEVTVGPAFDLGRFGIDNAALGVYAIGSAIYLDGQFYSSGGGAGARLVMQPKPGFLWTTSLEYRYRDYHDSSVAPTADERDGSEIRAYMTANYILSQTMALFANGYVQHDFAEVDYLAYTEAGFFAGPSFAFSPLIGDGAPWIFSPGAGFVYRKFEGPDPIISVDETEHDWELYVGADLTIPLQQDWALLAETEYRNSDSNYTTRDFDNFSLSLSVVKSF